MVMKTKPTHKQIEAFQIRNNMKGAAKDLLYVVGPSPEGGASLWLFHGSPLHLSAPM